MRVFLILALTLLTAGGARAQASRTLTMDLSCVPVREALRKVFDSAGVQYRVEGDVGGVVTLSLREQPFEAALRLLERAARLTIQLRGRVYIVRVAPGEALKGKPLDAFDTMRLLIEHLIAANVPFSVDPPDESVTVRDEAALLTFRDSGKAAIIWTKSSSGFVARAERRQPLVQHPVAQPQQGSEGPPVTLDLDAPLESVIAALQARFGLRNLAIEPGAYRRVVVKLQSVPLSKALKLVAQAAGATLIEKDGIVSFRPTARE